MLLVVPAYGVLKTKLLRIPIVEEEDLENDDAKDASPMVDLEACSFAAPSGMDAICCICMESISEGDLSSELQCQHVFHRPCLEAWLERRPKASKTICPNRCACIVAPQKGLEADSSETESADLGQGLDGS